MKKLLLSLLIIGWGCSEDDITDSRGTRLLSIDYASNGQAWTESYHYRADGALVRVEDRRSLGRCYELEYQDTTLTQVFTYQIEDDALIFRDSLTYTADGQIDVIHVYARNSGENLPLDTRYDFDYDASGKVIERKTYYRGEDVARWVDKYYWEEDNITLTERYDEEGVLHFDYSYTYDDQNNYKKQVTPHLYDPVNWSANNITVSTLGDYFGVLDVSCVVCTTSYHYNRDGYPVEIVTDWGKRMRLTYE